MQTFNLLPMYAIGLDEFSDGLSVKCTEYCKKKRNDRCQKYYRDIFNSGKEELYKCPYGFNSHTILLNGEIEIFTGFRLENKYDRKKTNAKIIKNDRNYIINDKELEEYISAYKKYCEMKEECNFSKKFIESSFHDIRSFNTHIKSKSEIIEKKVENKAKKKSYYKEIHDLSKNIWAMSNFISSKLNSYDVISAKNEKQLGVKEKLNPFKILDKIRKCFVSECIDKNVWLKLECDTNNCEDIMTYNAFELLLFLLIENAVKYSKSHSDINVNISDSKSEVQIIEINSLSPRLAEEEMDRIYEYGFRGNGAQRLDVNGSGIGMHLSDKICKLTNIKITAKSNESIKNTVGDIDYSIFSIKLRINKE